MLSILVLTVPNDLHLFTSGKDGGQLRVEVAQPLSKDTKHLNPKHIET